MNFIFPRKGDSLASSIEATGTLVPTAQESVDGD